MNEHDLKITADDWGLSPGINAGILELARKGIVKRVSLLANGDFLEVQLDELKKIRGLELGLHFNVTYGSPHQYEEGAASFGYLTEQTQGKRQFLSPTKFFLRCCAISGKKALWDEVRRAFRGQMRVLENLGIEPKYLDGHHHMHLFPGIMRALKEEIKQRGLSRVRLILDRRILLSRRWPLYFLSLLNLRHFKNWGFDYLPCLYPFRHHFLEKNLSQLLEGQRGEVIVHPALYRDFDIHGIKDHYDKERIDEYEALSSLTFFFQPSKPHS